jgi:hypothetical protein
VTVAGEPRLAAGPSAITDDRGMYRLANLLAGEYLVSVTAVTEPLVTLRAQPGGTAHATAIQFYPGASSSSSAQPITVDYGEDRMNVDFHFRPGQGRRVSGRINGLPESASAHVRLIPAGDEDLGLGSELAVVGTRGDGGFTFENVPPGHYIVRMTPTISQFTLPLAGTLPTPQGLQYRPGRTEFDRLSVHSFETAPFHPYWAEAPLSIGDGAETIELALAARRGARLSGRVVDEAGRPREKTIVQAEPADGRPALGFRASERTDEDGAFAIDGLLPGEYVLRASSLLLARSVTHNEHELPGGVVRVEDGGDLQGLVIALTEAGASLSGSVRTNGHEIAASAVVLCYPIEPGLWRGYGFSSPRIRRALAGTNGAYRFPSLPAGEYFVVAVDELHTDSFLPPDDLQRLSGRATRVRLDWGDALTLPLQLTPAGAAVSRIR